jgi:hypothetical protein
MANELDGLLITNRRRNVSNMLLPSEVNGRRQGAIQKSLIDLILIYHAHGILEN